MMTSDLRQSFQYGRYLASLGWQAEKINGCQVLVKKIPFLPFSIIKIQRPKTIPFRKINELAKKNQALFVKLEPLVVDGQQFVDYGYRRDSWPLLATKTIWVDLRKSEKRLWEEMPKKTRYCLRKAEENHLKIRQIGQEGVDQFYQSFQKFAKGYLPKKQVFQALLASFGHEALLFSADGLAGALILIHARVAYYYFAFNSPLGRQKFAQHLLVWTAIKKAKKRNCQLFDFEGIADPRYPVTRRWQGFSHFKKSFGGQEVEFPGSFTKSCFSITRWLLPRFA